MKWNRSWVQSEGVGVVNGTAAGCRNEGVGVVMEWNRSWVQSEGVGVVMEWNRSWVQSEGVGVVY